MRAKPATQWLDTVVAMFLANSQLQNTPHLDYKPEFYFCDQQNFVPKENVASQNLGLRKVLGLKKSLVQEIEIKKELRSKNIYIYKKKLVQEKNVGPRKCWVQNY